MKNAGKNLWQSRKLITKLKYILLNEQQQQQQRANEKKCTTAFLYELVGNVFFFRSFSASLGVKNGNFSKEWH